MEAVYRYASESKILSGTTLFLLKKLQGATSFFSHSL